MKNTDAMTCQTCGEELFELEKEFYCPSCDSVSGFELVPEKDEFVL